VELVVPCSSRQEIVGSEMGCFACPLVIDGDGGNG